MDASTMQYTTDPQETVDLVLEGADFSDYSTDELLGVVFSLLEGDRADLAIPLYIRIYNGVEGLLDTLMRYHAKYGSADTSAGGVDDAR